MCACGFSLVSSDLKATYSSETEESVESFIGLGQKNAACNNKDDGCWGEQLLFTHSLSLQVDQSGLEDQADPARQGFQS